MNDTWKHLVQGLPYKQSGNFNVGFCYRHCCFWLYVKRMKIGVNQFFSYCSHFFVIFVLEILYPVIFFHSVLLCSQTLAKDKSLNLGLLKEKGRKCWSCSLIWASTVLCSEFSSQSQESVPSSCSQVELCGLQETIVHLDTLTLIPAILTSSCGWCYETYFPSLCPELHVRSSHSKNPDSFLVLEVCVSKFNFPAWCILCNCF